MKKRNVMVVVLLIALLLMGSAYALWQDTVTLDVTAESATMELQFTQRTVTDTTSTLSKITSPAGGITTPSSTMTETISNLVPDETLTFTYVITNQSTISVDLLNVELTGISADSPMGNDLSATWTLVSAGPTTNASGTVNFSSATATVVPTTALELAPNATCTLEVVLLLTSNNAADYATSKTAAFTITPVYQQHTP